MNDQEMTRLNQLLAMRKEIQYAIDVLEGVMEGDSNKMFERAADRCGELCIELFNCEQAIKSVSSQIRSN